MPRDREAVISAAISRGAFGPERAGAYRQWAADDDDLAVIEAMPGNPELAAAAQQHRVYRDVVHASVPPGQDPILYASNPILAELERDRPALVAAARRDDPNVPELFGDSPLPRFTASGLDPAVLAGLPWPLRRPVAQAPTLAKAYGLVENTDDVKVLDLRYSSANRDYLTAMSTWLAGRSQNSVQQQLKEAQQQHSRVAASSRRDDPVAAAKADRAADESDLVGEALYDEIFGPSS